MSANNWATCPRCKLRAQATREAALARAAAAYGKVPREDYIALCAKVDEIPDPEQTLREDWDIGTSADGTFYLVYGCSCDECGFEHHFQHRETLKIKE